MEIFDDVTQIPVTGVSQTSETTGKVAFKRTSPYPNDNFESSVKNNNKKTLKIVLGCLVTGVAVLGTMCFVKGGAKGVKKTFSERMKDGWKELLGKNKGVADIKPEGVNKPNPAKPAEKVPEQPKEPKPEKPDNQGRSSGSSGSNSGSGNRSHGGNTGVNSEKDKFFNDMAERERQEAQWKANTDSIVEDMEQQLDGRGQLVPEIKKKMRRPEYEARKREIEAAFQEQEWKANTDKIVEELEQKLDGRISVTGIKPHTKKLHSQQQREYDELGRRLKEKDKFFNDMAERERQEAQWKANTDSIVEDMEQQLDGRGQLVPEIKKKMRRPEYEARKREIEAAFREQEWKQNTDHIVEEFEQKLDGSISVTGIKPHTKKLHSQQQREYDELGRRLKEKDKFFNDMAERERQEAQWKANTDSIVEDMEQQLDGRGQLVPEIKKKMRRPEYEARKREIEAAFQEQEWKQNTDHIVEELEQKLDGSISVTGIKPHTKKLHSQQQREYDELGRRLKEKDRFFNDMAERERQEAQWKANTDGIVAGFEQKLDGSGQLVPEIKEYSRQLHEMQRKYYDSLGREMKWKENSDGIVEKFEQKLDGSGKLVPERKKSMRRPEYESRKKEIEAAFREQEWKSNTNGIVEDLEQQLDGRMVPPETREYNKHLHEMQRKYYDSLGREMKWKENSDGIVEKFEQKLDGRGQLVPERMKSMRKPEYESRKKEIEAAFREQEWKSNTDKIVEEFEQKLDGSGKLIPEIKEVQTVEEHQEIQKEYDKLAGELMYEDVAGKLDGSIHIGVPKEITSEEHQAIQKEYDKLAGKLMYEDIAGKLDGSISVSEIKPRNKKLHGLQQREYDALGRELRWQDNTDGVVEKFEQKLDGRGRLVPEIKEVLTAEEHQVIQEEYNKLAGDLMYEDVASKLDGRGQIIPKMTEAHTPEEHHVIQKEYDALGRELRAQDWKAQTDGVVKEFEQKLDGSSQLVPEIKEAHTAEEHDALQKEYSAMKGQYIWRKITTPFRKIGNWFRPKN